MKLLLAWRALEGVRTLEGTTPLHMASQEGHVEAVELLLRARALVNAARRDDGTTPLLLAALENQADVAERLLEA